MRQGDEVYYLHGDHLGSTSLTTDASGAVVVSEARYLPYSQLRWGDTGPTDFGFTGQRNDSYMELIEMGARWYDSQLGRFISPDTIIPDPKDPQNFNRYAFVLNNPVKYRDPSGHDVDCGIGESGCRERVAAEKLGNPETLHRSRPAESLPTGDLLSDIDNWAWDVVPSVIGVHGQGTFGLDFFLGVDATPIDVALLFNWRSGEIGVTYSAGDDVRLGTPDILSGSAAAGVQKYYGASQLDSVEGASVFGGGNLSVDAWGKVGVSASKSWGIALNDEATTVSQVLDQGVSKGFFVDPNSHRIVTGETKNLTIGANALANGIDGSVYAGFGMTTIVKSWDLY